MVKLLFLKMLRDMKKSLAAYGICLLIVGVGFCGFCVMSVAKDHLLVSRDLLYEKSAFTEGFAEVYEAPAAIKDKLADIPGIGEVQALSLIHIFLLICVFPEMIKKKWRKATALKIKGF